MFKDILKLNREIQKSKGVDLDTHHKSLASVMVVDKERQKILLGKRRSDGIWTPPAGHLQGEESPIQAAIREAFEEANLQLKPRNLKDLPSVPLKKNKMCHVFITYVDSKALKIHTSNDPDAEVKKWEWFDLNAPLPKEIDVPRMISINNAKMKVFGMLRKAAIDAPDAAMITDGTEQSLATLSTQKSDWVNIIRELVAGLDYTDLPREMSLPKNLRLFISKVDDGFYSGFVKLDDSESGNNGEVLVQLPKMTPEMMVQILKTKGYIPREEAEDEPTAESVEAAEKTEAPEKVLNPYKGLYNALKHFTGDLHLHLGKSLSDQLTEGLEKRKLR